MQRDAHLSSSMPGVDEVFTQTFHLINIIKHKHIFYSFIFPIFFNLPPVANSVITQQIMRPGKAFYPSVSAFLAVKTRLWRYLILCRNALVSCTSYVNIILCLDFQIGVQDPNFSLTFHRNKGTESEFLRPERSAKPALWNSSSLSGPTKGQRGEMKEIPYKKSTTSRHLQSVQSTLTFTA